MKVTDKKRPVHIPLDIHTELKLKAIHKDVTLTDLCIGIFEKYLKDDK